MFYQDCSSKNIAFYSTGDLSNVMQLRPHNYASPFSTLGPIVSFTLDLLLSVSKLLFITVFFSL